MNRTTKMVMIGALALALLGAVIGGVALAQGSTGTPASPSTNLSQTFWQSLANRLGTTVDQLQQAFKDAGKDTVSSALQQNQITQDQANRLNERIDRWQPGQGGPFGFPFGKGFDHGFGHKLGMLGGQATLDAAAQSLGMSTADLTTELQSGKTLADVAKEKNVDPNTVKQAMIDAAKAQVDQAQQAGKLTADQANEIKQRIDQMAQNFDLSQPFFGRGGFGHDHRPWGPGRKPAPQAPAATPASTT